MDISHKNQKGTQALLVLHRLVIAFPGSIALPSDLLAFELSPGLEQSPVPIGYVQDHNRIGRSRSTLHCSSHSNERRLEEV